MKTVDAFTYYRSIKAHFTSNYDFHKYGISVGKKGLYAKEPCKYHFEKLVKNYPNDYKDVILACLFNDNNSHISDITTNESKKVYLDWNGRQMRLTQIFTDELKAVRELCIKNNLDFNSVFRIEEREHPLLVKLLFNKVICFETFCILNDLTNFKNMFNKELTGDPYWNKIFHEMNKYSKFIKYDKEKFLSICSNIMR